MYLPILSLIEMRKTGQQKGQQCDRLSDIPAKLISKILGKLAIQTFQIFCGLLRQRRDQAGALASRLEITLKGRKFVQHFR